ncbi:hypothetical protein L228DRAFT_242684 [Xylona heveae TC161]|uniref:MICOS complex subunit MIC60 n=1 Tax=Xylona heveae (strain CBS 132557 / TC161) TaxID=1328760 RepID=A0A165JHE3_XYLHT|nr:hypothetical protein L228DRAFT_242684 [Xylona heveae TC161]KZF26244.1 hypothetical protein L228DRAFT_242684 [Xylona heveae TC161]
MLRASLLSSRRLVAGGNALRGQSQWLAVRSGTHAQVPLRTFADTRTPEHRVPSSQAAPPPGRVVPESPSPITPSSASVVPPETVPSAPHVAQVQTAPPSSIPPTAGIDVGSNPPRGPSDEQGIPPPPPPRKRHPFRNFLIALAFLSGLGYAGGVYYSLVSDNFHDFFTEYVPFGEDAVLYIQERQFRLRFPGRNASQNRLVHMPREESNKVTIAGRSGVSWKVTDHDDKDSSSAKTSAVASSPEPAASPKPEEKREPAFKPASVVPLDPLNVKDAEEPVVQDLVKVLNNIITVINADNASGKYSSAIENAKTELSAVTSKINAMKEAEQKAADEKIRSSHEEFDRGARELVRRLEEEMRDQEARWREEFEAEREKISQSYQSRLQNELERAKDLSDQRLRNELLEQAIDLKRKFIDEVQERVENERSGRLGKLTELSSSVSELEKLTTGWNSVLDANLKTQHLHVAVEAVRANLETAEQPRPFIRELAALKEIADDDAVVNAAIASINPTAYQRGIPTTAQLIERFRRVAAEVRKAALLPDGAGVASHAASYVLSKFLFKKKGLAVGDDVESVLTRAETLLEEGQLDDAAREVNSLQGWAKTLSKDWLAEVRSVLEVQQALEVIATEARLQSLRVD